MRVPFTALFRSPLVRRAGLGCLAWLASTGALTAQIRVEMEIPRRLYLVYEPILVTVAITNLAGQDILLHDDGGRKWFGFDIVTLDGRIIPPSDPDYKLPGLQIAAGETVRRQINVTPLYALGEFGTYKVRANVWFADLNRDFTSAPRNIELTDGKLIWRERVGVPEGGTRVYSLLTHRRDRDTRLYVRVEDVEGGVVYATTQIGPTLSFAPPKPELDASNVLHVLHMVAPKTFFYTQIDTEGRILAREVYEGSPASSPRLRRTPSGSVSVAGGRLAPQDDRRPGEPPPGVPKLSDRTGMPAVAEPGTATPSPTPAKRR